MLNVASLLARLQKVLEWEDGEDLSTIGGRLTSEQLAGPGELILLLCLRAPLPGLVRARVLQHGALLFEVQRRLSASLARADIEALARRWQGAGYLGSLRIDAPYLFPRAPWQQPWQDQ